MEMTTTNEPMPPKVASAIKRVAAEIGKLAKTERNTHGNYNFASIDAFYAEVGPKCAEAGLIIVSDEIDFEVKADWLSLTFAFTLAHESGETWSNHPRRSGMVSAKMGAQAFGAAQSYAEKMFLRSLFKMVTGDAEDADSHEQRQLPQGSAKAKSKPAEKPPAHIERAAQIAGFMQAMGDVDELEAFWDGLTDELPELRKLNTKAVERLEQIHAERLAILSKEAA